MKIMLLDNHKISNIISCDTLEHSSKLFGESVPYIDGANIGDSVINGAILPYVQPKTSQEIEIDELAAYILDTDYRFMLFENGIKI